MSLAQILLLALGGIAGALFLVGGKAPLPYGRHHATPHLVLGVPVRLAWCLMALPGLLVFGGALYFKDTSLGWANYVLIAAWFAHYGHRSLIYPLQLRGKASKRVPLTVVVAGVAICSGLSYVNADYVASLPPLEGWLSLLRGLYGLGLFITGYLINRVSDLALCRLRQPHETGHKIPQGAFFSEVSCPNYLGEIVLWTGWAIMTWSQAGFVTAALVWAILLPRAVSHQLWYQQRFPEYPRSRRALFPVLL